MSWNFEETSGSGKSTNKVEFAKFQEGITVIRVLDDVPFFRWAHWMPQFKRKVTCIGHGCPVCELDKKLKAEGKDRKYGSSRNWALNIFNRNTGKHELLEQGITFMEELREIMEDLKKDGKQLSDAVIRIRMRVSNGKSSWRFDIESDDEPWTPEELEAKKSLVDKDEYFKAGTKEQLTELLSLTEPSVDEYIRVMFGTKEEQSNEEIGEELHVETE